ncbi:MAG: hypothetical protein J0H15_02010 [Xanthomonadales bacterium]|nr:hypothetical protein [Xanthomonadales bacterium]
MVIKRIHESIRLGMLLRWGHRGFAAIAIAVITVYLLRNRVTVTDLAAAAQVPLIAASIAVMALVHFLVVTGFHYAHRGLALKRPYRESLASYFVRLPARYVPGGIWHTAARYIDIRAQHVLPKRIFAQIFLVESCLVAASGLMVAGVASRIWFSHGDWVHEVGAMALMASIVLVFTMVIFARAFRIQLQSRNLLLSGASFSLHWIVVGIGFAVYARAFPGSELGTCSFGVLASAYQLAASLGYVAIFSPQGWGVTELVFGSLSTCNAPLVTSVAAITGFRLIGLVADLLAYATTLGAIWIVASRTGTNTSNGASR